MVVRSPGRALPAQRELPGPRAWFKFLVTEFSPKSESYGLNTAAMTMSRLIPPRPAPLMLTF